MVQGNLREVESIYPKGTPQFRGLLNMRAIKMSVNKLQAVMDSFLALVKSIENEDVRNGLDKLMDEMGERFFSAPASAKLDYHNCFPGGLVEHSLRVYSNLEILRKNFSPDIPEDSVKLVALFHDVGKLGTRTDEYFLPQDNEWRRNTLGEMYTHNTEMEYFGSAMRSIRLLVEFGVPTTEAEFQAILIHDGQYTQENKPYAHKENILSLLIHQADMLATKTEKDKWKKAQ